MLTSDAVLVEDLYKTYIVREGLRKRRIVEALRGVTFRVRKGTIHALLGPNGAGKTTTLKIIATLLLPDKGRVEVLGHDVAREPDKVRKYLGVVLDVSRGFYLLLSGYENLVFYGLLRGMSIKEARRRARQVLELVGLDKDGAATRPYHTYSLGMRARLAIAKALMTDPEVLLLDEPTLGLDVESARMVRRLLLDLTKEGRTILVTGHNMYEIEQIAHEVTIIHRGRVVVTSPIDSLKSYIGSVYRLYARLALDNAQLFLKKLNERLTVVKEEVNVADEYVDIVLYVKSSREDIVSTIFDLAKQVSIRLLDFSISEPTLEDVYITIMEKFR